MHLKLIYWPTSNFNTGMHYCIIKILKIVNYAFMSADFVCCNLLQCCSYPINQTFTMTGCAKIPNDFNVLHFRSNGLVVKALDSQSRGPVFKTTGWLKVDSAVYPSEVDKMNFWELSGKK